MKYKFLKIAALVALPLLLNSCQENATKEKVVEEKECCKKKDANESGKVSEESIYNVTSFWQTQNKEKIQLSHFEGKLLIAAMVFTHCEAACPRIVADIQRIEKEFTADELKQINFLLISMDPERDSSERLLAFSKEYQMNNNWTLITGTDDATMEMANILGVRVKKLSDGGFDHSNTIFLIDRGGNIVHQQNGLEQEPTDMINNTKTFLNK